MHANVGNKIALSDIAGAVGCSEQALLRMFQEYREMDPLAILSVLRD